MQVCGNLGLNWKNMLRWVIPKILFSRKQPRRPGICEVQRAMSDRRANTRKTTGNNVYVSSSPSIYNNTSLSTWKHGVFYPWGRSSMICCSLLTPSVVATCALELDRTMHTSWTDTKINVFFQQRCTVSACFRHARSKPHAFSIYRASLSVNLASCPWTLDFFVIRLEDSYTSHQVITF